MKPSQQSHAFLLQWPKARIIQLLLFFASCATLSIMLFHQVAGLALLQYAARTSAATSYTPEALNPKLTNTIGDKGGPTLYYNGSGPVPP